MSVSILSIIAGTFSSATPIALAGVGGIFGEKSGIVNIGLEGTMLFGAFSAAAASYYTNNAWLGLLCGVLVSVLISLLHAFLCIRVKIDHNVSGLAINIAATNITIYFTSTLFGNKGTTPPVPKLPNVTIPLLSDIPGIGVLFRELSILTVAVPFLVVIVYYVLYKTDFGLHVIASGEKPRAAYVLGINVERTQYLAVLIGGLFCGLAGGFLSISYLGMFVKSMTASRGFIAIATILVGRYNPIGVAFAGLLFGFAMAIQMAFQGIINIPGEIIQCLPYVLTIVVVVLGELQYRKKTTVLQAQV